MGSRALLRLALRNLLRHGRRSLLTASALALGLAVLVVGDGLADGAHGQMVKDGVAALAGHVVVQGRGWQESRDPSITVENADEVARVLQRAIPDGTVVERVYFQGLLCSPEGSAGVGISAVQPLRERQVDELYSKLVEGSYLDHGPPTGGILLGATLAETLDVGLDDKVVLMAQQGGELRSHPFRVRGIFRVGIDEIDGFYAQVTLQDAQELLGLDGAVTQVSVHLPSSRDTGRALRAARRAITDPRLEVLSWKQAMPELYEWIALDSAGLYVMVLMMAVIVAIGILNTSLMSVFERMREFGVLLALGMRPSQLARLVLLEAALLGLAGTLAGLAIALPANAWLAQHGLDASAFMGESMEAAGVALRAQWYSDLSPTKTAIFSVLAVLVTVGAAVPPALRAARLQPVDCLRHG